MSARRRQQDPQLAFAYATPAPVAVKKPIAETPTNQALLAEMNPEQSAAIMHRSGPMSVLAGAGSGKTRVIIHRVAMLVRSGVSPNRILAVTFSKNGQLEMERRGKKMGLRKVDFRTWHSLALMVIRKGGTPWARWPQDGSDDEEDDDDLLPPPPEEATDESSEDNTEEEEEPEKPKERRSARTLLKIIVGSKGLNWINVDFGQLRQFIGYCKAWMWSPESTEALAFARRKFAGDANLAIMAFRNYDEAIEEERILTYDDMLLKCVQWLEQGDHANRWAARWDHLLQDEAQDASAVQLRIAHLLARGHRNYFVVGDPAQAIFSFRGSYPDFILNFGKEWLGSKTITMFRNYRCGSDVIKLANSVIGPSRHRLPEPLAAECGWPGTVTHHAPRNPNAEAELVANSILVHQAQGSKLRDNVVLYRLNSHSRAIEEKLLQRKIPYYVVGGIPFYQRREVRSLLSYLRLASGIDVVDSMRRSINTPNRYLGKEFTAKVETHLKMPSPTEKDVATAIDKACKHANVNRRQIESANEYGSLLVTLAARVRASGEPPYVLLRDLISKTGFEVWLRTEEGDETVDNNQVANVKELVRVSRDFTSVASMLEHIALVEKAAKKQSKSKVDRVLLMTIHKCKGLEFRHVHFIGATEKIIPHPKAEDEDEERRLFYVAVTRAAHTLMISSPLIVITRGGVMEVEPSDYLIEAALQEVIDLDGEEHDDIRPDEVDAVSEPKRNQVPAPETQTNEQRIARLYSFIRNKGAS